MNEQLLQQQIEQLIDTVKEQGEDIKELNRRVNSHDTSMARMELIVEGMKNDWMGLKTNIERMIEAQTNAQANTQNTNTAAFKEIIIELIKMTGLIVGIIAGAKIFLT